MDNLTKLGEMLIKELEGKQNLIDQTMIDIEQLSDKEKKKYKTQIEEMKDINNRFKEVLKGGDVNAMKTLMNEAMSKLKQ
jgi:hypothetical protein